MPDVKALPHSLETERDVLGACIVHPEYIALCDGIPDSAWYRAYHVRVMKALRDMRAAGVAVDLVTVTHWMRDHQKGEVDVAYNASLSDGVPWSANVDAKIDVLMDIMARRRMVGIAAHAWPKITEAATAADAAETFIGDIREATAGIDAGYEPLANFMQPALDPPAEGVVMTTGWPAVDNEIGACPRLGELLTVCARPGHGKTAIAMALTARTAASGVRVGLMSLEMLPTALYQRLIAARAGFPLAALRKGAGMGSSTAVTAAYEIQAWPVDMIRGRSVDALRRHVLRKPDTKIVIVDYLQLLNPPAGAQRYGSRTAEVAATSAALRAVATEHNVAVVILAQLNREVESRGDGTPRLSDLRESGAIEQDSDVVWGLYMPSKSPIVAKAKAADANRMTLRVLKHRNGKTGHVHLHYNVETQFIAESHDQEDDPEPQKPEKPL